MEGDERVETYMHKVKDELERSGLTGQPRIYVYNRCYEAVMKSIQENDKQIEKLKDEHKRSEMAWREQDGSQCIRINCIYRRIICEENAERREAQRGRDDL